MAISKSPHQRSKEFGNVPILIGTISVRFYDVKCGGFCFGERYAIVSGINYPQFSLLTGISYMIYNDSTTEYKVKFYKNTKNGKSPALEYIKRLTENEASKVLKYIEFLRVSMGYLDEPYSKHIKGKIRELRVDFGKNKHRIFYFTFIKKTIILLHAFLKKTAKTPAIEIKIAEENYFDVFKNPKIYE